MAQRCLKIFLFVLHRDYGFGFENMAFLTREEAEQALKERENNG